MILFKPSLILPFSDVSAKYGKIDIRYEERLGRTLLLWKLQIWLSHTMAISRQTGVCEFACATSTLIMEPISTLK